ncbi:MAG: hypothetical protein IBX71_10080 [Candidatus Desulforudis sp.]|nr:hypothetical protein [Desulforudis sp.]
MYWRDYRTEARAAAGGDASAEEVEKAVRKLARDAKAAREKTCPRCGRRFVPPAKARKTQHCELCRADVRREKGRERKRRERASKTGKEPGVVCHALLK